MRRLALVALLLGCATSAPAAQGSRLATFLCTSYLPAALPQAHCRNLTCTLDSAASRTMAGTLARLARAEPQEALLLAMRGSEAIGVVDFGDTGTPWVRFATRRHLAAFLRLSQNPAALKKECLKQLRPVILP